MTKYHRFMKLLLWLLIFDNYSIANPIGGRIAFGSIELNFSSNNLEIVQNTEQGIIDWDNFDIRQHETVNFIQPNTSSVILNRIHSAEFTQIDGRLLANGKLILINPNGIMFSSGSKVDVNWLLATTAGISNEDFISSINHNQCSRFNLPGNPGSNIMQEGVINLGSGLIGLVAPNVINMGIIIATIGKVELRTGELFTIDLYGDQLLEIGLSTDLTSQLLLNTGEITVQQGKITLTTAAGKELVNSFIVHTGKLAAISNNTRRGEVIIFAEGSNAVIDNIPAAKGKKSGISTVLIQGFIDVSGGLGAMGGKAMILGDHIELLEGTIIESSVHGDLNLISYNHIPFLVEHKFISGEIIIGGWYLGQGKIPTAISVLVDESVILLNDAIYVGNAGRTILWSDGFTKFYGIICARGLGGKDPDLETGDAVAGGAIGDGGFVHISSKNNLDVFGTINLTASNGKIGRVALK